MDNKFDALDKLLASFWFTASLLSLLALSSLFFLPRPSLIAASDSASLPALAELAWRSLLFFFAPLGVISAAFFLRRGRRSKLWPIAAIASVLFLLFIFAVRAEYLDNSIKSGLTKIEFVGGPLDGAE